MLKKSLFLLIILRFYFCFLGFILHYENYIKGISYENHKNNDGTYTCHTIAKFDNGATYLVESFNLI